MKDDLTAALRALEGISELKENESMSEHCSFRAGGCARWFLTVERSSCLEALFALLKAHDVPWFLLGRGSNLLVADSGFDGVVIRLGKAFEEIRIEGELIRAGAAAALMRVAAEAAEASLSGLEFASGIPGSVGGGLTMNAGAYGGEIADVCSYARIFFPGEGIRTLSLEELKLGYRHSILKEKPGILLDLRLRLHFDEKKAIMERMEKMQRARKEKQPLEYPSAGSTFKRPEGAFAGKLISEAGCKGMRVGGACVSEKHAGFIVNDRGASADEIFRLMRKVRECVLEHSGIHLEPEVILLGVFETDE